MTLQDPYVLFGEWLALAEADPAFWDANAMCVSTVSTEGFPSSRILLLKGWDARGFVFYTNKKSQKAGELLATRVAALNFYWEKLGKQIRIDGGVEEVTEAESDAYFATRSRESRIGAWASQQSSQMPEAGALEKAVAECTRRFEGQDVPRPPHWGGFRVIPRRIEFWQAGAHRLHTRHVFTRENDADNQWQYALLYP